MLRILMIALLGAVMGCQGTLPAKNEAPAPGASAILLQGKFLTPQGETRSGQLILALESEQHRYRLKIHPKEKALYLVKPGWYRLKPARNILGKPSSSIAVVVNGRPCDAPFPPDLLNHEKIEVKPDSIIAIGVLEARLSDAGTRMAVTLDAGPQTRGRLLHEMIQAMSDLRLPDAQRNDIVAWAPALQQAVLQLQGSREKRSLQDQPPE